MDSSLIYKDQENENSIHVSSQEPNSVHVTDTSLPIFFTFPIFLLSSSSSSSPSLSSSSVFSPLSYRLLHLLTLSFHSIALAQNHLTYVIRN